MPEPLRSQSLLQTLGWAKHFCCIRNRVHLITTLIIASCPISTFLPLTKRGHILICKMYVNWTWSAVTFLYSDKQRKRKCFDKRGVNILHLWKKCAFGMWNMSSPIYLIFSIAFFITKTEKATPKSSPIAFCVFECLCACVCINTAPQCNKTFVKRTSQISKKIDYQKNLSQYKPYGLTSCHILFFTVTFPQAAALTEHSNSVQTALNPF